MPQFHVDLVTFTEEILNEKLHFYAVKLKHGFSTDGRNLSKFCKF